MIFTCDCSKWETSIKLQSKAKMKKTRSIITGVRKDSSSNVQLALESVHNMIDRDASADLDNEITKKEDEFVHLEFVEDPLDNESQTRNNLTSKVFDAVEDAKESDESDKKLSLIEALKQYPKAAGWSVLISTTLIMEGYDTTLINALFALPVFQQKFGSLNHFTGNYEITAKWQIGLNMCISVGEIIGLQFTGYFVERLGNRWVMIISLLLLFAFNFLLYFCQSLAMIAVGMILSGMPWGVFQSLAVSYASEICPLALRYYLTSYVNMCWLFGQLFASGILKNSQQNLADSDLGYKLPFALQWIWPAPLAIGIYFAPESPWWLIRKNRMEEARRSLSRVSTLQHEEKQVAINMMVEKIRLTIEKEALEKAQQGSYWDCFKGVDARRTRIACLTWVGQNTCGSVLLGYSTYFFEKAGLDTSYAFTFSIIQYCLGLFGTMVSWLISGRLGRYTIMTFGLAFQMVVLLIIGGLGFSSNSDATWGIGSLLVILAFFYNVGIGPVVYCIISEIPTARLRTQTIILARNSYNLMAVVNAIWTPYMLNSDDWNWGAKTGLFWGGFCGLTLLWAIIDLPETTGRTFSEIDELFAQRIPARKFKTAHVDPFGSPALAQALVQNEKAKNLEAMLPQEEEVSENI